LTTDCADSTDATDKEVQQSICRMFIIREISEIRVTGGYRVAQYASLNEILYLVPSCCLGCGARAVSW
jgi:hypothetical protein